MTFLLPQKPPLSPRDWIRVPPWTMAPTPLKCIHLSPSAVPRAGRDGLKHGERFVGCCSSRNREVLDHSCDGGCQKHTPSIPRQVDAAAPSHLGLTKQVPCSGHPPCQPALSQRPPTLPVAAPSQSQEARMHNRICPPAPKLRWMSLSVPPP